MAHEDMKIKIFNTKTTLGELKEKVKKPSVGFKWLGRTVTIGKKSSVSLDTIFGKKSSVSLDTIFKEILKNRKMNAEDKLIIFQELNPKGKDGRYHEVGGRARMKILNKILEEKYKLNVPQGQKELVAALSAALYEGYNIPAISMKNKRSGFKEALLEAKERVGGEVIHPGISERKDFQNAHREAQFLQKYEDAVKVKNNYDTEIDPTHRIFDYMYKTFNAAMDHGYAGGFFHMGELMEFQADYNKEIANHEFKLPIKTGLIFGEYSGVPDKKFMIALELHLKATEENDVNRQLTPKEYKTALDKIENQYKNSVKSKLKSNTDFFPKLRQLLGDLPK